MSLLIDQEAMEINFQMGESKVSLRVLAKKGTHEGEIVTITIEKGGKLWDFSAPTKTFLEKIGIPPTLVD